MKGNYYNGDESQDINTNGLSDNRLLRDGIMDDNRNHENVPDNVDRMLKLFNIPLETLPCPEKRQANEILMEQMSKNENINSSNKIFDFMNITLMYCIIFVAKTIVL